MMTLFFQLILLHKVWLILLLVEYPLQVGTFLCTLIIYYFASAFIFVSCKQYTKLLKEKYKKKKEGQASRSSLFEECKSVQRESFFSQNDDCNVFSFSNILHLYDLLFYIGKVSSTRQYHCPSACYSTCCLY